MWKRLMIMASLTLTQNACSRGGPAQWEGPVLAQSRTQLTVDQLNTGETLPLVDMSFFAKPDWAEGEADPFSGTISFAETQMLFPKEQDPYTGEDLFPQFTVDFVARNDELISKQRSLIDTRSKSGNFWGVVVGAGAVWREQSDQGWSRASFPLNLIDRYVGQVRNCVAGFVYKSNAISKVYVQCSQETAVPETQHLANIRVAVTATYEPKTFTDTAVFLKDYDRFASKRFAVASLSEIDRDGRIADYFSKSLLTNASTSLGAVYMDGKLYMGPAKTRHGSYPYPDEMRHGVFSVTKSMAGALAMFYFAERYGEGIFDELIVDYVPALADRPEWKGVTFSHALNMVTGVRSGEDLLYEPLELAPNKEVAIKNIAQFGDFPEAPGEKFNYATTNTFVLSYALENYVQKREGEGVHYWDLIQADVLKPIGAEDFHVLHTRDEDAGERIPILGLGASPNLDNAAKIALLIFNEGKYEGRQILNRNKIREALGRTRWRGHRIDFNNRYRHSFWSRHIRAGGCSVSVVYMQGLGANHVFFLPSGVIVFRFMDESDYDFDPLVRAVEKVRSSCQ